MKINENDRLFPRVVQTPNIEDDILQYLGDEILEKWKVLDDKGLKQTIVVITERLDFISHLNTFMHYVSDHSHKSVRKVCDTVAFIDYNFVWNGHDFSGVQFDIEALNFYLLLTCIDAIQSQPTYVSAFDWLKEKADCYQNKTSLEIIEQLDTHSNLYSEELGLRKKKSLEAL